MIGEKTIIQVPSGIRYLGNWNEFNFSKFPDKCIINKELPGCGLTEYCLKGKEFVILCSPRIMLINNKSDQHPEVFLVKNEMDKDPAVDKDLEKNTKGGSRSGGNNSEETNLEAIIQERIERNSEAYEKIKTDLNKYLNHCFGVNQSPKILVTYDSYHIVKDILIEGDIFREFYTVIDEFQSILHDARFKSDTEMQFLNNLKSSHSALFVSATPMMEEYLNMLDEFDGLPYFQLDWGTEEPSRIIKPNLDVYLMRSVTEKASQVIKTYLDGNFESVTVLRDEKPTTVISKEAVLYVNSVNHITSIIKKNELQPDQVLILCSNTDENEKKVKKLGKSYSIGHVPNPAKGEKFPMFTFCTRTVYLGADFYSDNARTFIFSDANIDSLSVDISEDLPQILGRQRLNENPWKNSAIFYYRTTADYRRMKWEDFKKKLEQKMDKTDILLGVYNRVAGNNKEKEVIAETYQKLAKSYNYKDDYVAVNRIYNPVARKLILKPVRNNLVYINELRAFKIQQIDYKDRFTVFSTVNNKFTPNDLVNHEVAGFLMVYNSKTTRYDKLKLLSEYKLSDRAREVILSQIPDDDDIKSYYTVLGPDRLKELGYNVTLIKKELKIITFDSNKLKEEIYKEFSVGDKIILSEIKTKLQTIYNKVNYNKTPKAIDLNDYFETKESTMRTIIGGKKKTVKYYELLKIK